MLSVLAAAETPRRVDFQGVLSAALLHSPLLQQAEGDRELARAQVRLARSGVLPRVTVNGTLTRLDADRKLGERVLVPATAVNGNVTAVVPLLNAQGWLGVSRAETGLAVADASRDEVRRAVARAVAGAYVSVVLRQQLREVTLRAVQVAEAHVALAKARFDSGVASRLDVLRAERELSDNRARLASATADVSAAQQALGAITGDGVPLDAAEMPQLGKLPSEEDAVAALRSRPDVRAAEARLVVAEREVKDRWADYVPTLALQAQPFAAAPATPTVPNVGWQAQLQLGWLAYDGGGIQARQAAAEARVRQARAAVEQLRLTGTAEVRAAWSALSQREVAEAESRVSAKLAEEAAALAKRQFEEGVAGNLELVDAERAARDAESAAAVARAALVAAKVDYLVASGVLLGE